MGPRFIKFKNFDASNFKNREFWNYDCVHVHMHLIFLSDKNILIGESCLIVWPIDNIPEFDEGCLLPVLLLQGVHVSPASVQTGQFLCCDGLRTCKHGTWTQKGFVRYCRKSKSDPIWSFLFLKNGIQYTSIIIP